MKRKAKELQAARLGAKGKNLLSGIAGGYAAAPAAQPVAQPEIGTTAAPEPAPAKTTYQPRYHYEIFSICKEGDTTRHEKS